MEIANCPGFAECLGNIAPFYNLLLVLIALLMFMRLFNLKNKNVYMLPWQLLFLAVVVFIIEEILTVFYISNILMIPRIYNAVFEFVIISIFIYLLLKQKEYLGKYKKDE